MCISYKNYSTKTGLGPSDTERPWGEFRQFTENAPSTIKILKIKPNEEFSLQSHTNRDEFWRIIKGGGTIFIDTKEYEAKEDYEFRVPRGSKHRIKASEEGMQVLEISTGDFDEGDITRFEDKYGRV